jgi:hypothetical protein
MTDRYEQARAILAELAAETPPGQDGPAVMACPRCYGSSFIVTPSGRVLCGDDTCYELFGYAVIADTLAGERP